MGIAGEARLGAATGALPPGRWIAPYRAGVMRKSASKLSPPPTGVAVQEVSRRSGTLPMATMSWLVLLTSEPVTATSGETTV